ncbi:hypothetical protein J19TS2_64340 [Cohnella xylanilytica]|nr:hypothetical protein J19TS2_64340 [Cohnella xylanilytica]
MAPFQVLKNPESGLLDQAMSADHGKAGVARKGVQDPRFILISPKAQTVHLSKDVEMARAEQSEPHPVSVQGNGAVVKAKKLNRQFQKTLDKQVANDFFFG